MSIWASVQGSEVTVWDGDEGVFVIHDGFLDIATAVDRVRIVIRDEEAEARISLDAEGLCELHRRIVIARDYLDRAAMNGGDDGWTD